MPILNIKGKFLLIASVLCLSILVSSMVLQSNLTPAATGSNDASDSLTSRVVPWGWIEVYVYDNESNPLVSASVICSNTTYTWPTKNTNAAGFVNLTPSNGVKLYPGLYNVTASKVGFISQRKTDLINWGGDDDYLSFYLKPMPVNSSYIVVNVTDAITKAPVVGAAIHVLKAGASTWTYRGVTDGNGILNVTGLEKYNWYYVNASKAGYITQQKTDYINWEGDDDYLYYALKRVAFNTQTLTLNAIVPNPDPSGDIHLQWNDLSGETGYTIYRGSSEGTLEVLTTVGPGITTYYDVGVSLPSAYYMIIASNGTAILFSNLQSVVIQEGGGIPGFEIIFVLLAIVLVFYISRSTKFNFKSFLKNV